jgi:hypothetical protein
MHKFSDIWHGISMTIRPEMTSHKNQKLRGLQAAKTGDSVGLEKTVNFSANVLHFALSTPNSQLKTGIDP